MLSNAWFNLTHINEPEQDHHCYFINKPISLERVIDPVSYNNQEFISGLLCQAQGSFRHHDFSIFKTPPHFIIQNVPHSVLGKGRLSLCYNLKGTLNAELPLDGNT